MSETPLFHFLNNSLDKGFCFTNVISTHDSFLSKYNKEKSNDWKDLRGGGESSDFFRQQFEKFRNGDCSEVQMTPKFYHDFDRGNHGSGDRSSRLARNFHPYSPKQYLPRKTTLNGSDAIEVKLKELGNLIKTLPNKSIDFNSSKQTSNDFNKNLKLPWYFNSAPSPILRVSTPNQEVFAKTSSILSPLLSSTPFPLQFVAPLPKMSSTPFPAASVSSSLPSSSTFLQRFYMKPSVLSTPGISKSLASSTIDLSSTSFGTTTMQQSEKFEVSNETKTKSTLDLSANSSIYSRLIRTENVYNPYDQSSFDRYNRLLNQLNSQHSVVRSTREYKDRKYRDENAQRMAQIRDTQTEIRLRSKATRNRQIKNEENTRMRLELEGLMLEHKPKEDEFPELSDEAIAVVKKAWNRNAPLNEVLTKSFNVDITRRDLLTIAGLEWLNDEVINFYMNLIIERGRQNLTLPKVYAFNTFFYQNISSKGYESVKRWTRKIDIFSYDILIIPVHLTAHWCLATVDFKQKCIQYYDSMYGKNEHCLRLLKEYLEQEHKNKKNAEYSTGDWRTVCRKDIPRQHNGSDCGMFTCKFAEYASRRAEINFNQSHMPYFRERMVYEICAQKLL